MRILALQDYQTCFLSHTIITGLYENGYDVYESPILENLRGRMDEGYRLPDGTSNNSKTGCAGYLRLNPLPEQGHTKEEIHDLLACSGFDLIILLSLREHSIAALNHLIPLVQDRKKLPIVACDGEDSGWIDINTIKEQIHPFVFFKREMKKEHTFDHYRNQVGRPVFPCNFAAFTRGYPDDIDDSEEGKTFDLFLSLGYTNQARSTLVQKFLEFSNTTHLTSPSRCHISTNSNAPVFSTDYGRQIQDLLPWPEYIRRQAQSKIGASMVGHGSDCLHTYELASFATAMLYCNTGNWMPHPPRNLRECIVISEDCGNVAKVLEHLLKEDEFRIKLANAGRVWCRTWQTTKARAAYVIDVAKMVLDAQPLDHIREKYDIS